LLTADQIRQWAAEGIEFGAHSRTHPDLRTLTGSRLAEEIAGRRQDLERILGSPVSSFAYPYGLYNEAVIDCVREHFELAWTTRGGLNDIRTDPHALRRTMVLPGDSGFNLSFRVLAGWTPREFFRWLVARTTRLFRTVRG
jgi:peptidoglycan/xylan/chitin deacetylase (PgdA/CDA1 family)